MIPSCTLQKQQQQPPNIETFKSNDLTHLYISTINFSFRLKGMLCLLAVFFSQVKQTIAKKKAVSYLTWAVDFRENSNP